MDDLSRTYASHIPDAGLDPDLKTFTSDMSYGLRPNSAHEMTVDVTDEPEWKVQNDYSYYQPLDHDEKEIRLVTIAPGSSDDALSCTLTRHVLKSTEHEFEALSYCWGDLYDTVPITLEHDYTGHQHPPRNTSQNRDNHTQLFNVTRSLNSALKDLRYKDKERILWIDALCINQGSIKERNYAIAFMVEVYRVAAGVIIFLDSIEKKTRDFVRIWQLMDMLRAALEQARHAKGINEPLTYKNLDIHKFAESLRITSKTDKAGHGEIFRVHMTLAFEEFFDYPWFQRVWVVQEALNAKMATVVVNGQKREWLDVMIFLMVATAQSRSYAGLWTGRLDLKDRLPPFLWKRLIEANRPETTNSRLPLLEILAKGRAFRATDPRDKVFALLSFGLETNDLENLPPRLKPDYNKSCSEVWRDLTIQWIIEHQSLDILGILREEVDKTNRAAPGSTIVVGKQNTSSILTTIEPPNTHPSWALWHEVHSGAAMTALFRLGQDMPKCSFPMDVDVVSDTHNAAILSLRGIAIGKIKSVQWPFRRWVVSDKDMTQMSTDAHASYVEEGVPNAWGITIGLVEYDAELKKYKVNVNKEVSVGAYPDGGNILQSFIEALLCKRFSRQYFLAGDEKERYSEFLDMARCLEEDNSQGADSNSSRVLSSEEVRQREDLKAMAHFAAHWTQSRSDPDMKWLPKALAQRLQTLVKYGSSKSFTEMCMFAEGRCFFKLDNGAFGLCPQGSQEGDWAVSLSGGKTPFVIRPMTNEDLCHLNRDVANVSKENDNQKQDLFSLIGECYIHSLDLKKTTQRIWEQKQDSVQMFRLI